jgi:hypothetical protein
MRLSVSKRRQKRFRVRPKRRKGKVMSKPTVALLVLLILAIGVLPPALE